MTKGSVISITTIFDGCYGNHVDDFFATSVPGLYVDHGIFRVNFQFQNFLVKLHEAANHISFHHYSAA